MAYVLIFVLRRLCAGSLYANNIADFLLDDVMIMAFTVYEASVVN